MAEGHEDAHHDRRTFLAGAGVLAAGAATLTGQSAARAAGRDPRAGGRGDGGPGDDLVEHATRVRIEAARAQGSVRVPPHPANGDEQRYPNHIGSDTRGLPHDARGEVDPAAWAVASAAYASGRWEDFEQIPLGGTRKFVNPVGTLAPGLEGTNVSQVGVPPAPALAGPVRAAEAVENWWQALLRDVPFAGYASNADVAAAAAELDGLSDYTGPKVGGRVTPAVLFRGSVTYTEPSDRSGRTARHVVPPGVLDGPFVPQFLFRSTPYGSQSIPALHRVPAAGQNFLLAYDEWLAIQNGAAPTRSLAVDPVPRHPITARDLGEWGHGFSPQHWGAALQLAAPASGTATAPAGIGAPLSPTNPYVRSRTQAGAHGTFALGHLQALLTLAIARAVRAVYWQKWFVHRSVRPEAFGGLVHHRVRGGADYPVPDAFIDSQALARATSRFGTGLLAQAYPEAAPLHGSYPAGSAAIAGASATIVKAFFDERAVIPDPVQPDPADPTKLVPWTGAPLTVGGEVNKLAVAYTFSRVIAGIHWRSDAAAGLAIGERVAESILADERRTFAEPFDGFRFTRFDGSVAVA